MPVHRGKDKLGSFYMWGKHGAKYYWGVPFKGKMRSKETAYHLAVRQAQAAHAHGYLRPARSNVYFFGGISRLLSNKEKEKGKAK